MAHPVMSSIVRLRIAAIELAHAEGEVRLRRFNEKMIVIVHQAIRVAEPAKAVDDMGEEGKSLRPITVVHHDILPGIAPTGDMIERAGKLKAKWTGHGAGVYASECMVARPDPTTLLSRSFFLSWPS